MGNGTAGTTMASGSILECITVSAPKRQRAEGFCQAIADMIKYGVIVTKNTPKYRPLVQVRGRLELEQLFYKRLHIERYYNSSIGYTWCSRTPHVPEV